jgi:hypothetical protein
MATLNGKKVAILVADGISTGGNDEPAGLHQRRA